MSFTTRWSPFTEPGAISLIGPIPVPKTIAQAAPGGVNCTTHMPSLTTVSWRLSKPMRS